MHPALIVIIGVMGPFLLVGIIGIIYGLYTNSKNVSEHGEKIGSTV